MNRQSATRRLVLMAALCASGGLLVGYAAAAERETVTFSSVNSDGETGAARLLRRLGGLGESAQLLAYRLYTVCERRKWSQDAIGYNALVLAWPDLTRLAQEQKAAGPSQGELI